MGQRQVLLSQISQPDNVPPSPTHPPSIQQTLRDSNAGGQLMSRLVSDIKNGIYPDYLEEETLNDMRLKAVAECEDVQ